MKLSKNYEDPRAYSETLCLEEERFNSKKGFKNGLGSKRQYNRGLYMQLSLSYICDRPYNIYQSYTRLKEKYNMSVHMDCMDGHFVTHV